MSIFQFLGMAYVVLGCCVFTVLLGWLALHGIKRLEGRFAIGEKFEDDAIRTNLGEQVFTDPNVRRMK